MLVRDGLVRVISRIYLLSLALFNRVSLLHNKFSRIGDVILDIVDKTVGLLLLPGDAFNLCLYF